MLLLQRRLALVLFGIFRCAMVSTSDLSIEDRVASLEKKMTQMAKKLSLMEGGFLEDRKEHELVLKGPLLESRLADLAAEVTKCGQLITGTSGRMDDMVITNQKFQNHYKLEVEQLKSSSSEAVQMVERVRKGISGELEKEQLRTSSLQNELNDTRHVLRSFLVAHGVVPPPADQLWMGVENIQKLGLQDVHASLTKEMRHIEKSISKLQTDCVGHEPLSRLNESLQAVDRTLKQVNHTLRQQTSLSRSLDGQLEALSCTGEPPYLQYGKPVDLDRRAGAIVRYECNSGFVLTGNSTVRCRFGTWDGQAPGCTFFDTSFVLVANGTSPAKNITCYSDKNYRKITFSRVINTGSGAGLPRDAKTSTGRRNRVLELRTDEKFGVFQCGFNDTHGAMATVFSYQHPITVYFKDSSIVANVGDTVELEVVMLVNSTSPVKWLHNGVPVPDWNDQRKVLISRVQVADAGIYEFYLARHRTLFQTFTRLIVRKCEANLFGELCDKKCPPCYNGGVCHDVQGICVCPPGYSGNNCEVACEEGHFGADCSEKCPQSNCRLIRFCKPDPYGCSCAPGYNGTTCAGNCGIGWYGPDCTQLCHCAEGPSACDRTRGTCSGGCLSGWTGQSCQIPVPG